MDKDTTVEAWKALKDQFEASSKNQLFKICIDFFSFVWNSKEDVSLDIAKLKTLLLELINGLQAWNENPQPEILLLCKILQVFPIQFETFKKSWILLTKNEERKFEEMSAQLTMYERNHKERQEKEDQALVVRT